MIRHFKEDEFNNFGRMNCQFMEQIDEVRDKYRSPFIVKGHSDFRESDKPDNKKDIHELGRAVDFHIDDGRSLYMQAIKLVNICDELYEDKGWNYRLGVYPYWNNPGFHYDNKEDKLYWICDKKKEYHYFLSCVELFDALEKINEE